MARERKSGQNDPQKHEGDAVAQDHQAGGPTSSSADVQAGWETNYGTPLNVEVDATDHAAEKKARREFYGAFTKRTLAKTGDNDEGEDIPPTIPTSTERELIIAWTRWVDLSHRVPEASARLFCFPWAGGNSLAFNNWRECLPGVEVVPICLPGRHTRVGENALLNVADIVDNTVDALRGLHLITHGGISFSVFGHELGALLAFELCRRVQEDFPAHTLFVSGMSCPQMVHMREKWSNMCHVSPEGELLHSKNSEFQEAVLRRGDVPPEVSENNDLMEIFTPLWYADLRAMDTYVYHGGSLLECPIFTFGGESCGENLEGWGMETTSKNDITLYPGRCLYLLNPDNEVKLLRFLLDFFRGETDNVAEEAPNGTNVEVDVGLEDEDSDL